MNDVAKVLTRDTVADESESHFESGRSQDDETGQEVRERGPFQVIVRPTIIATVCVMMYLREGWVVGNAGILGAALIILLTFLITGTSALVLSSISTNARSGGGGVLSVISRSLGFESGGSIGLPFYLGHVLSIALYLYGFSEVWQHIFPNHPQMLVACLAFGAILAGTLLSRRIVHRLQDVVLLLIVLSLGSIFLGLTGLNQNAGLYPPQLWGSFNGAGFWVLFAVFFAAGTGLRMEVRTPAVLEDPRRSIPRGMLMAVGISIAVYLLMALWYSRAASPFDLQTNALIVVDRAAWGPIVLAAILAATFAAALITLIAAPQMLQTLSANGVLPDRTGFGISTSPIKSRAALAATSVLVLFALLPGSLDRVAVLVTLVYLLTYLTIHLVSILELGLGVFSFRPLLHLPLGIPVIGAAACFAAMFIINPFFALAAPALIAAIFIYLMRRPLSSPATTARSGLLVAAAEWITDEIARAPDEGMRSWKPKLIVPVKSRAHLDGTYRFLRLVAEPNGSLSILGVKPPGPSGAGSRGAVLGMADRDLFGPQAPSGGADSDSAEGDVSGKATKGSADLDTLSAAIEIIRAGSLKAATAAVIEAPTLVKGFRTAASVLDDSHSRPNLLLGLAHLYSQETMQGLVDVAEDFQMSAALLHLHPDAGLGHERVVNVWVSDKREEWRSALRVENLDLALLLAYRINHNMGGQLRLSTFSRDARDTSNAREFLDRLIRDARLPVDTDVWIESGNLLEQVGSAPHADLHVMALSQDVHHAYLTTLVRRTGSSFLFVRGSGRESALA